MTPASFTLLDPAAAITAAAICVPALLFLYFLKLRRRPVRVSSTLLWTQAVQDLQVNAPFRWIRPTWLLLLQLLGLACLLLASGRPALDSSGAAGSRVIVVIDASASMSARDAGANADRGSRLDAARGRAKEFVDQAVGRADARAMVVSFAADATSLTGLTRDKGLLRQAIDSIEATDQPGDLDAALRLVETIATRERGENDTGPFRVILLSDVGTPDGLSEEGGLEGATLEFVRVGPEPERRSENVGIVSLAVRRDYDDPGLVRAFVRVLSTVSRPTDLALRLTLDGKPLETGVLKLPAASSDAPATGVRTLTFRSIAGGTCVVTLVRDDVLVSDNAAGCVLPPSSALRIALVRRGDADVAATVLEQALASIEPFELRVLSPEAIADPAGASLKGIDLIVYDRVAPLVLPGVASLSLGASLPLPGVSAAPSARGEDSVAFWERAHPVMRYLSLAGVRLVPGNRVRIDERALGAAGVRSSTLASGLDGALITLLEQGLTRRIIVGFALSDTNWWRSDSFPIFIANAVDSLTRRGDEGGGEQFTTTQPVRLAAPTGRSLTLAGAGNVRRTAITDAEGVASFGVIPLAGVYTVQLPPDPARAVAVNVLDEGESAIATRADVTIAGKRVAADAGTGGPREIWAWFVAAGLALLTVEWLVFAWRMRV